MSLGPALTANAAATTATAVGAERRQAGSLRRAGAGVALSGALSGALSSAFSVGLLASLLGLVGLGAAGPARAAVATAAATACEARTWPLWQDFNTHFIAADARVLAANTAARDSFSEAQSYAMFFA